MERWLCVACGTQFLPSPTPPADCPICLDERQYVPEAGQAWMTLTTMQQDGLRNRLLDQEENLIGISTTPKFAIGQRALLVQTGKGNLLWDCISLVDDETVAAIQRLGGIQVIAISHPHYYAAMVEWAERFDALIYLHEADREWVMSPNDRIHYWSGDELPLLDGVTLVRLGGHYPGSTVLHWRDGAEGKGALFTGDTIQVGADRRQVSFMYSYPNNIPLSGAEVRRIGERVAPYAYDRLYGFTADRVIRSNAKSAVGDSVTRYLHALASPAQS
jgi:glyoxylase-like metal-dependent hydrolase (beta-lactamase superfamily II)